MIDIKEIQRIAALRNYRILDTVSEEEFDAITKMASYICETPISLITLIDRDRQWFKSTVGVGDLKETPRSIAFCTHTIAETDEFLIVNDLTKDERFVNNPFVVGEPFVKFYAGVSLIHPEGHRLGTVCVFDQQSRQLSEKQLDALKLMSKYVISLLEERKKNRELVATNNTQKNIIDQLEQFTYAIAHDIKAPLRTMASFSGLLARSAKNNLDKSEQEYLDFIVQGAKELSNYTQKLLKFSKESAISTDNAAEIDLKLLIKNISSLVNNENAVNIIYDDNLPIIFASEVGTRQILHNLISNSIKYRNLEVPNPYVGIDFSEDENYYHFSVIDNGLGMNKDQLANVFKLFHRNEQEKNSTGIGLNVVKRLVEKLNGHISIQSQEKIGTTVKISIEKIFKG